MDQDELRRLVGLCRELGVTRLKTATVELDLGPAQPSGDSGDAPERREGFTHAEMFGHTQYAMSEDDA